jgi:WD40 repeat protein
MGQAATGKPVGHPLRHQISVSVAAFHPDGRTVLTGCWQEPARMWDVGSSRLLIPALPHPDEVRAVAISPDGRTVLTGCKDGIARFWVTATGKLLGPTLRHQGRVLALAYSPDGRTVLTGSYDRNARIWHAHSGEPLGPALSHNDQVGSFILPFSDNHLFAKPISLIIASVRDAGTPRHRSAFQLRRRGRIRHPRGKRRGIPRPQSGSRACLKAAWNNAESGQPEGQG